MKRTILLVAMFAFGLLAAVALAGGGKGGGGSYENCTPTHYGKHHKCHPTKTTTTSSTTTTTQTTTTFPTTSTSLPPPLNTQKPVEAFCMQTAERGETFVQANPDSFKPGGDWYTIWKNQMPVKLDGHVVTPQYEDGHGVILAAKVPGVGLTCDQPYVSTNGVYADPSYGLR